MLWKSRGNPLGSFLRRFFYFEENFNQASLKRLATDEMMRVLKKFMWEFVASTKETLGTLSN